MKIGDLIKLARKNKGLKQSELAEMLSISASAIGLYEQNRREPDIGTIIKIAKCLDVSVEYLLGLDNKSKDELSDPDKVLLEATTHLYNAENTEKPAKEGELTENVVIFHRDGKTVKRKFTKEQLALFHAMLDAIPEDDDEDDI